MSYVVFENQGEIDPRLITTFGVSVKETANPIGFFGTGLKYAIAILLRENCKLWLVSGQQRFEFTKEKRIIRGKEFEQCLMQGQELPFTTHLGANWQLWQALRELYCNCLDEKGHTYVNERAFPEPSPGRMYFVVESKEFLDVYFKRDAIVLGEYPEAMKLTPLDSDVTTYSIASSSLYYRGIRVKDWELHALYTYNVLAECTLTEDRTIKFDWMVLPLVYKAIARATNKSFIRMVLTAPENAMESKFDFNFANGFEPSVEFLSVLAEEYHLNNDRLNKSARKYHMTHSGKMSAKSKVSTTMSEIEHMQCNRAVRIAKLLYPDLDQYPIVVVDTLGQETMAVADMVEKVIVIAKPCFKLGTKFIVSTLIEEYTHLKYGYYDHTRDMQTHLFDTITTLVETHLLKEPI